MAREVTVIDVPFPLDGLHEGMAKSRQPPRTCVECVNVRAFEPQSGRARGGQRSGLSKYNSSQLNGSVPIQDIIHIITAQTGSPLSASLAVRTVTGVATSGGTVKTFTTAGYTAVTNGTTALSTTAPVIFSCPLYGALYFADGVNTKLYTVSTNTITTWTPTAGSLPVSAGKYCRLIELWHGRIVLSGLQGDAHNWFMSAVDDPLDYDYAPTNTVETQAVAGNNSDAGLVGDIINCMIPYNDDILIFGGDHSLYQLTGDPMAGGRIDLISSVVGMAWGRPYCMSPEGTIYFFGSRGGVFRMTPGSAPQRLSSKAIEERLSNIDLSITLVRMVWNDKDQCCHVFITPLAASQASIHVVFDARNESWWIDRFSDNTMNPRAVHTFDGDSPSDRAILLGSDTGYIRQLTQDATSDDGTAINSYVVLGPIQVEEGRIPFVLQELWASLAEYSADISVQLYIGDSAEHAISESRRGGSALDGLLLEDGSFLLLENPVDGSIDFSGTLSAIRSTTINPRLRGYAAYIQIGLNSSGSTWAMEMLTARLAVIKTSRGRQKYW